jgi:hypothetical protein
MLHYQKQIAQLKNNYYRSINKNDAKAISKTKVLFNSLSKKLGYKYLQFALGFGLYTSLQLFSNSTLAQSRASFQFGQVQNNPFGLTVSTGTGVNLITNGDIDADGDIDLLAVVQDTASSNLTFDYINNIGTATAPNFQVTNPTNPLPDLTNFFGVSAPHLADLDNDGDLDLMVGTVDYSSYTSYAAKIVYFENIGTPQVANFDNGTDNPFGLSFENNTLFAFPATCNFDGDSDIDLIVGTYSDSYYIENIGSSSSANFDTLATLQNKFELPSGLAFNLPAVGDIDNDGDQDILMNQYYVGGVLYSNNGTSLLPEFGAPESNPSGIAINTSMTTPNLIDIDGDGDLDLLMGGFYGSIYYQEQLGNPNSVKTLEEYSFTIYPNPVNDKINIANMSRILSLKIFSLDGRLIKEIVNPNNYILVDDLVSGYYTLEAINSKNQILRSKFIKN